MSKTKLSFAEFYYGLRPANSRDDIILSVQRSPNFRKHDSSETINGADAMLLFEIDSRASWLVRTNARIYKIIDDRREELPTINWSVSLEQAKRGEVEVINSKRSDVGRLWKVSFSFRQGRQYLVDPKLFQGISVEAAIESFIKARSLAQRE